MFSVFTVRGLWFTFIILSVSLFSISGFAFSCHSKRTKDIAYVASTAPDYDAERHILDVYYPRKKTGKSLPVVVFIHGGNWNSGKKDIYWFIGRRLAKQGVVAVIINYRLAPNVQVPAMAHDCARAVQWTAQHIADYGGDPSRIFVMGHSAGGGLAALLATKNQLFTEVGMDKNPVKGAILDDAAGLDMFTYLTKMEYPNDEQYLVPFGKDRAVWRSVSPIYFLDKSSPPMLVYVGGKTYPGIANSSKRFNDKLQELGIRHEYRILDGKKHVAMAAQLFWKNNIIYRNLLELVGTKP